MEKLLDVPALFLSEYIINHKDTYYEGLRSVTENPGQEIKEKLPKVYSKDLVETIFKLPYTKRQNLINAELGSPKTVGNYLIALGKEKLYLNLPLMSILEN